MKVFYIVEVSLLNLSSISRRGKNAYIYELHMQCSCMNVLFEMWVVDVYTHLWKDLSMNKFEYKCEIYSVVVLLKKEKKWFVFFLGKHTNLSTEH